jgi:hypothetical protein
MTASRETGLPIYRLWRKSRVHFREYPNASEQAMGRATAIFRSEAQPGPRGSGAHTTFLFPDGAPDTRELIFFWD